MPTSARGLPVLFFDGPLPDVYRDLVDGRAIAVGPDEADLARAHGVVAGARKPWNADTVANGPLVRVVSRTGVGYDNLDVPSLASVGVVSCHTPTGPLVSTAEHTVALMLAITKRLPIEIGRSREGLATPAVATALELDNAVLGLIGFGRIARRVAVTAQALGMRVLAFDPFVTDAPDGVELVDLDALLGASDVVSLHAPGGPGTRHLINTETLRAMKPGSYLGEFRDVARSSIRKHLLRRLTPVTSSGRRSMSPTLSPYRSVTRCSGGTTSS